MKAFVIALTLLGVPSLAAACDVNQFRADCGYGAAFVAPQAFYGGQAFVQPYAVQQFAVQPVYAAPFVQFNAGYAAPFVAFNGGYAAPFRAFGYRRGFRATPFRPFVGPVQRGFRFGY